MYERSSTFNAPRATDPQAPAANDLTANKNEQDLTAQLETPRVNLGEENQLNTKFSLPEIVPVKSLGDNVRLSQGLSSL